MFGLFNELGPCEVVQLSDGTYGTQASMWGWDRSSNILFIDQPNQVGFSYDTATNASLDLFTGQVFEPPTPNSGLPGYMYRNGTYGTANFNDHSETPWAATANTTDIAAQATWHFLQTWLSAFPQYNPAVRPNITTPTTTTSAPVGVNLFAESYGGKYGPVFANYFEEQNQARLNGSLLANKTLAIKLEALGIVNGLVDDLVQDYYYPIFAYNNTYGIELITQADELNSLNDYTNDCMIQIQDCRDAMSKTDPEGSGDVNSTNQLCSQAQFTCNGIVGQVTSTGYYPYDIRQRIPSPDPPAAYQEYLNNETVLAAIGARVNYTESNPYVQAGFVSTGDTIRGGQINDLASLLTMGVRVALIYGDADFLCNWYGGEAISFAVAAALPEYPPATYAEPGSSAPPSYAAGFPAAGYADIVVNKTYVGGAVRQYGNLSFSRIYNAGHFVPYFQPETAFTVFTRVIDGSDISLGDEINLSDFGSNGTANATYTTSASYSPTPTCWVRAWNQSCSEDDTSVMLDGSGVVVNGIFFQKKKETTSGLPSSSVVAGVPGNPISSIKSAHSSALTGVYTATGTPSPSSGAAFTDKYPPSLNIGFDPLIAVGLGLSLGALVML